MSDYEQEIVGYEIGVQADISDISTVFAEQDFQEELMWSEDNEEDPVFANNTLLDMSDLEFQFLIPTATPEVIKSTTKKRVNKRYLLTNDDRKFILESHWSDKKRPIRSIRYELMKARGVTCVPNWAPIRTCHSVIHKWRQEGTVLDLRLKKNKKNPWVVTAEFKENLRILVEENPMGSQRFFSGQLKKSKFAIWKGLKELGMKAYRLRKVQRLKPNHIEGRLEYCKKMLALGAKFLEDIWFVDESYCRLGRLKIISQNCRFYSDCFDLVPCDYYAKNANFETAIV